MLGVRCEMDKDVRRVEGVLKELSWQKRYRESNEQSVLGMRTIAVSAQVEIDAGESNGKLRS